MVAIVLGLASAAALAQVAQPGSPPTTRATSGITPMVIPDAGTGQTSAQPASDAGPAAAPSRTGDQKPPAQRIYSFDPLPIGTYSFEAPAPATSQSSPSSNPR
jgi:hypothetical protein